MLRGGAIASKKLIGVDYPLASLGFAECYELVRSELDDAKVQALRTGKVVGLGVYDLPAVSEILVHLPLGWYLQWLDLVFLTHCGFLSSLATARRRTRRGRALPHLPSHRRQ